MQIFPRNLPAPIIPPTGDADRVAELRDDVESLTVYETAAKAIFVKANGLQAYYRTYYKHVGQVGSVEGSRKGDKAQIVWRASALAGEVVP